MAESLNFSLLTCAWWAEKDASSFLDLRDNMCSNADQLWYSSIFKTAEWNILDSWMRYVERCLCSLISIENSWPNFSQYCSLGSSGMFILPLKFKRNITYNIRSINIIMAKLDVSRLIHNLLPNLNILDQITIQMCVFSLTLLTHYSV